MTEERLGFLIEKFVSGRQQRGTGMGHSPSRSATIDHGKQYRVPSPPDEQSRNCERRGHVGEVEVRVREAAPERAMHIEPLALVAYLPGTRISGASAGRPQSSQVDASERGDEPACDGWTSHEMTAERSDDCVLRCETARINENQAGYRGLTSLCQAHRDVATYAVADNCNSANSARDQSVENLLRYCNKAIGRHLVWIACCGLSVAGPVDRHDGVFLLQHWCDGVKVAAIAGVRMQE